jgi:hypothetical protein
MVLDETSLLQVQYLAIIQSKTKSNLQVHSQENVENLYISFFYAVWNYFFESIDERTCRIQTYSNKAWP